MEKPSYLSLVFLLLYLKTQAQGLNVSAITYSIAKPLLEEISDGHTIVGQKLILKCTLRYHGQFTMDWNVPNENGIQSHKINFGKLTKTKNKDEYFRQLEIENTTMADQGAYTCTVRSSFHVNNVTKIIRIFNSKKHFIYLSEQNGLYDTLVKAGTPMVQWWININAHPKPKLIWYDNNDKEILTEPIPLENPKYYVMTSNSFKKTMLTINNITIFDKGYYKLKAISDLQEQSIRLFLNVTNETNDDFLVDNDGLRTHNIDDKKREILINEIKRLTKSAIKRGPYHINNARIDKLIHEASNAWQLPMKHISIPEYHEIPKSEFINMQDFEPTLDLNPQFNGSPKTHVVFIFCIPLLLILLIAFFV